MKQYYTLESETCMETYEQAFSRLKNNPEICRMKKFHQHRITNTYEHVCHVAAVSRAIQKALHLHVDEKSMLRGAMLHDYYLYDFHQEPEYSGPQHISIHPQKACENAEKEFGINNTERNIILSHMWPLNPTSVPKSKEAWIVSIADKICAFSEVFGLAGAVSDPS